MFTRPLPRLPRDVDECAWDAHLCQEGQRCMNLLGSYHCLPDCRPGFQVAPHGAGCEGDRGRMGGCPYSAGPRREPRRCHVPLGVWASGESRTLWQKER